MPSTRAKAAVLTGPRTVEVREVEVAAPGPGEVQITTLYSGISAGTEMNVYRGVAPQWNMHRDPGTRLFSRTSQPDWSYPLVYGYANVGRVTAAGEGVTSPSVGEVVFSYQPHQSVVVTAGDGTVVLPAGLTPKHGVLNANLNTALNGVLDARPALGDTVVVSGLGVIGLLVTELVRRAGAGLAVGVDRLESRRRVAERLGTVQLRRQARLAVERDDWSPELCAFRPAEDPGGQCERQRRVHPRRSVRSRDIRRGGRARLGAAAHAPAAAAHYGAWGGVPGVGRPADTRSGQGRRWQDRKRSELRRRPVAGLPERPGPVVFGRLPGRRRADVARVRRSGAAAS